MTDVLGRRRGEKRETQRKWPCKDGGRVCGYTAKSQGNLGPLEIVRGKKDSYLEPSKGIVAVLDLAFGLLASRTMRK